MPPPPNEGTDGSKTWTASHVLDSNDAERWTKIHTHLNRNEFRAAITTAFELAPGDSFTYHASASVNLGQVEAAIRAGRTNGLHAWYVAPVGDGDGDDEQDNDHDRIPGQPSLRIVGYPPTGDIQAYVSLFDPAKLAANSLKSLAANAKKASIRASVAEYLVGKRYLDKSINVPKFKVQAQTPASPNSPPAMLGHMNPALDFWAYACHALEYAGPNANTALVRTAHHILPVYMHHFGCVVPSWEALQIVARLAVAAAGTGAGTGSGSGSRGAVLDMGSGNGYWTLMLRRLNSNLQPAGSGSASASASVDLDVVAVDSGQSQWRTTWIADTVVADGVQYLRRRAGCPDRLLLLVYPIVGADFTRRVLDAYTGSVICVAGTQNGNGYTGFKDMTIDQYMATHRPQWEKVCQIPLPSYAGKDDALFAFRRKDTLQCP